jgi:hypothetical protein
MATTDGASAPNHRAHAPLAEGAPAEAVPWSQLERARHGWRRGADS